MNRTHGSAMLELRPGWYYASTAIAPAADTYCTEADTLGAVLESDSSGAAWSGFLQEWPHLFSCVRALQARPSVSGMPGGLILASG